MAHNRNRANGHDHAIPMAGAQLLDPRPAPRPMHVDPAAFEADFQPFGDQVLIRILKQEKKAGEIELPDSVDAGALGRPPRAQIIKVGPGMMNYRANDGSRCPVDPEIKVGRVIYPIFQGGATATRQEICGEKYLIISAQALIGGSLAPPESL